MLRSHSWQDFQRKECLLCRMHAWASEYTFSIKSWWHRQSLAWFPAPALKYQSYLSDGQVGNENPCLSSFWLRLEYLWKHTSRASIPCIFFSQWCLRWSAIRVLVVSSELLVQFAETIMFLSLNRDLCALLALVHVLSPQDPSLKKFKKKKSSCKGEVKFVCEA